MLAGCSEKNSDSEEGLPLQTCTLDNGRVAATAIVRMKTALEYGRVPSAQIGPLVRSLLGALHVR